MLRSLTFPIILLSLLGSTACQRECRVVTRSYYNDQEQEVLTYPTCGDTSYYKRQLFHENGQLAFEGFFRNGQKTGAFKSWAANGQQTAQWAVRDGKEDGYIQCWYENGHRKKICTLDRGVENGLLKTWYENGRPESSGRLVQGKQEGAWTFWDEDGGWKTRSYRQDVLWGPTTEHLVDSTRLTLVSGQYVNGKEAGVWRWFDRDSVLYQSVVYVDGRTDGAYVEYYPNGNIKARGTSLNDALEGPLTYFDGQGRVQKTETYVRGRLISTTSR